MTTGRAEQPEDGPLRRRRRWHPRDSKESPAGRMEQLADVGRSDPAASGLKDYVTFRERDDPSVRRTGLGATELL